MQRSSFKQKLTTPLKRTALKTKTPLKRSTIKSKPLKGKKASKSGKKVKKLTIKQLKGKLWNEVKRLTRERYGDTCYTCGATNLTGSNLHSGHGKPMGALPLRFKYDIRNIRPQCMLDNIHRGGCQDIFIAKLAKEEDGLNFLKEACYFDDDFNAWRIKQNTPSLGGIEATIFVEKLYETYKNMNYL